MLKIATIAAGLAASIAAVLASNAPASKQRPHEQRHLAASPERPVLVELYQSQGCSSCPPANANVNAIADRPDVVALSFAVTYWDALGWKDTFASPAFTERQWDYARHNHRGNVATPQVWINGRTTIVGSSRGQLAEAIANAAPGGPLLAVNGNTVQVGEGGGAGAADLWVAFYDPRTVQVPIRAGENGGRTLPHKNIVRELARIGRWNGHAMSFTLPRRRAGLATAVFLQSGKGGPVIAAAKAV
jgi:hypothetical protein